MLYRSFCLFSQWEYGLAIPLLRQYITSSIPRYQRLVGSVNLAAALTGVQDFAEARTLLTELLAEVSRGQFHRLHGNCLEMMAQISFFRGDLSACFESLERAERLLAAMPTSDLFFVRKWRAIASSIRDRDPDPLLRLRQEALARRDWETVRETDRHQLRIRFDERTFERLIFGTPFPAYRQRICGELDREPRHDSYLLGCEDTPIGSGGSVESCESGESVESAGSVLDLISGHGCAEAGLNVGEKPLDLIEVLARDFYRPKGIGALFSHLHPNERFNPFSSAPRLHQLISRTRAILDERGVPLAITQFHGTYQLEFPQPGLLRSVPFACPSPTPHSRWIPSGI
ncbi:MAG: tetratricopeptide repeat protein [Calothrix sp. SM1_5_4]|nr:tetratricopeptide repeat protein [Calothrix sp. SM1_5_4]